MKTIALLAAILVAAEMLLQFFYPLPNFQIASVGRTFVLSTSPFFLVSSFALMLFFIVLYKKQTKN